MYVNCRVVFGINQNTAIDHGKNDSMHVHLFLVLQKCIVVEK